MGEVLWCYNTSESCWAVLCCEAVYCTLNSDSNFWNYQWYPFKLLDVSINNGNWTEWSVIGLMALLKSLIPWSVLGSLKCRCDHSNDNFLPAFFICYWWCYQFERSLGLAILDLCPPGHLSQQALLVDIIFKGIGHLSGNSAPHFSDQGRYRNLTPTYLRQQRWESVPNFRPVRKVKKKKYIYFKYFSAGVWLDLKEFCLFFM